MILSIKDRILISRFLPTKGNMVTLTIRKDLEEKIRITQKEILDCGITEINGSIKWDKDVDVEIEFTRLEIDMLKEGAARLDKEAEITFDMLDLYQKVIALP